MNNCSVIIGLACTSSVEAGEETEKKYLNIYKPFLRELYKHQNIKAVLYFPGVLLEWFEEKHPEMIMLLEELIKKRKQVELLGSGYYEPILPMLSPQDRTGQIEALTTLIRKKFGKRPRGFWLTGSFWENSLVMPIKNSGMDYVFLDYNAMDASFADENEYYQPFITEDSGKLIVVFPVHSCLIDSRERISSLDLSKKIINKVNGNTKVLSLIFREENIVDIEEKWISDFFDNLSGISNVKIINPASYLKNETRLHKKYFQNKIYYKKILAENVNLNLIYARMVHVQTLINQIRGDKYKKKSAIEALWAGQNYISYCAEHGNCPDMLNIEQRRKTYKKLIEAEIITRQKGVFIPSLIKTDFDLDGVDEYLFQGEEYNAFLHVDGGAVFELDCLKGKWNYSDVFYEADGKYHLGKSFLDYLLNSSINGSSLQNYRNNDISGMKDTEYSVTGYEREKKQLEFTVKIKIPDENISFTLIKVYRFMKKKFEVVYKITNTGTAPVEKKLAAEINLSLFYNESEYTDKAVQFSNNEISLDDSGKNISLKSDKEVYFCIDEQTTEEKYYYTTIMPVWELKIAPGESWENKLEIKL